MIRELHVIERALQIARSGKCSTVSEVRTALDREGYSREQQMHLTPTLIRQLSKACSAARKAGKT